MKRLQKENNGITLIVLVMTIIILLILAGITITKLAESRLFGNAQLAREKSENMQSKENKILIDYEDEIVGYINGVRENSKINYSLEEQSTGITWIDGKIIYQKTMICEYPSEINSEKLYDLSNLNIDNVISIDAMTHYKNSVHSLPYLYTATDGKLAVSEEIIVIDLKTLRIRTVKEDFSETYAYVTIQYTKAK